MSEPTKKQGARRENSGESTADHRADDPVNSPPLSIVAPDCHTCGHQIGYHRTGAAGECTVKDCPCLNYLRAPLPAPDARPVDWKRCPKCGERTTTSQLLQAGGCSTCQSEDDHFVTDTKVGEQNFAAPASASRGTADPRIGDWIRLADHNGGPRIEIVSGEPFKGWNDNPRVQIEQRGSVEIADIKELRSASPDASARRELEKLKEVLVRANAGDEAESESNYWARYGRSHAIALIDQRLSEWPK